MRKFTLIELLVVVAIIGILVTILLPSLNKAREKARIAVELSNRKQLHTATSLYLKNNSGLFPPRQGTGVTYLHNMKWNPNGSYYDLNSLLIDTYLGNDSDNMIRAEVLFCDSTLFDVRNPETNYYDGVYGTLSYFLLPSNGTKYETTYVRKSIDMSESSNALWSCVILDANGKWMGHNAPLVFGKKTDGASTVFVDGAGKWMLPSSYKLHWGGGWPYYRPVRN